MVFSCIYLFLNYFANTNNSILLQSNVFNWNFDWFSSKIDKIRKYRWCSIFLMDWIQNCMARNGNVLIVTIDLINSCSREIRINLDQIQVNKMSADIILIGMAKICKKNKQIEEIALQQEWWFWNQSLSRFCQVERHSLVMLHYGAKSVWAIGSLMASEMV